MIKKMLVLLTLAFVFCVPQTKAAGGQFTLYAGYLNPGELNFQNVQAGLSFRDTGVFGARVEFDFLKVLGIEQNFGFSQRLFNSTLFPTQASEVRGFLYSSNLVLNLPIGRFVPYATAGVGLIKPWGSSFASFDATFAGNYGGGIKFNKLAGPIGLRFDVRGWRTADIMNQGGVNLFETSGGLTFSW